MLSGVATFKEAFAVGFSPPTGRDRLPG